MDIELELVRHIAAGHYKTLRKAYTFTPDLLGDTGGVAKLKAVCNFADEHSVSEKILRHEFSWLEDEHFDDPETDMGYLIRVIKDRYVSTVNRGIVLELAEAEPSELQGIYVRGMREIQRIMSNNTRSVTTQDFGDVLDEVYQRHRDGKNIGVSLGFPDIDEHTGGIKPGHLSILAALPKRMKTWFLIKAFIAQAEAGENPILFSLELSYQEVVQRIACLLSKVSYSRMVSGNLDIVERKLLSKATEKARSLNGTITQPGLGERLVSHLFLEADRKEATSLLIDQFSFLSPVGNHFKENEGYKEIIYDLKNMAVAYDLPIYMAAQLNREQTNDDFPIAQHLGLTRAVEEASDLIMGIQINSSMREDHTAHLGVVEARHCESGPQARWRVEYSFKTDTSFEVIGKAE